MNANVNQISEKAKQSFLQANGWERKVQNAIKKTQIQDYATENKGAPLFFMFGLWLFPIMVATLSTFGIGEILSTMLPSFLAYTLAAVFVILIELGQAAFARPLCKRIVKQQTIQSGIVFRVLGFTILSIGLGAVSFYNVILNTEKRQIVDNTVKFNSLKDSVNKTYNARNALLVSQLNDLNKAKTVRFKGLLMPEEQNLQREINQQLTTNDSLQKTETQNYAKLYPTLQQPTNWTFSPVNFVKIIGSLAAVFLLGFLTLYCHYLDFKHAKAIVDESSRLLECDEKNNLGDEVKALELKRKFIEVYRNIPGYDDYILARAPAAQSGKTPLMQHNSNGNSSTNQPTAKAQIGFNSIKKQYDETKNEASEMPVNTEHNTRNNDYCANTEKMDGNRQCAQCGKLFIYKNQVHKYCGDECRIQAYELKTGRKLTIKKRTT